MMHRIPERETVLARQDQMNAADAVNDDRGLIFQALFGGKSRANVMLTLAKDGRRVDFCAGDLGPNSATHLRNLHGCGLVKQITEGVVRRRRRLCCNCEHGLLGSGGTYCRVKHDVHDRGKVIERAGDIIEVDITQVSGPAYFRRVDDPIWTAIDMLALIGIDPRAEPIREHHMELNRAAHDGTVEDLIALAGELGNDA